MIAKIIGNGKKIFVKKGTKVIGYATFAMLLNIYAIFVVITYLILQSPV